MFTTGRGGVGNRSHSVESARQADASQTSLSHEKKVISQYKAKNAPTYRTGRGGAGAKGHVKALALVPNTEMVLAKERDIQYQWNLEKQMKGDIKTGRGGRGNILKGRPEYEGRGNSNSFDNSQIRVSSSRAESRRENGKKKVLYVDFLNLIPFASSAIPGTQTHLWIRIRPHHSIPFKFCFRAAFLCRR